LFRDNLPTVQLGAWDLKANLFDGDTVAGLVPSIFTSDMAATTAALNQDAARTQWDLLKLNKLLFSHEAVSLKEACSLLKKPR